MPTEEGPTDEPPAAAPPAVPATAPEPVAAPVADRVESAIAPPAPVPAPAPVAAAPTPAPAPRATSPVERTCFECRPGESAIFTETEIVAGGADGCPSGLAGDLVTTPIDELPELLASLPAGCAVLRIDLPLTSRYSGFRYESSAGDGGRSADCFARQECAQGGLFPVEPVVRKVETSTVVFALFESRTRSKAGFTVYWSKAR
jgi:hypothetical protein